MPWKETRPETEQKRLIERWRGGEVTFVELCRRFGVSRKTGYKRVQRFQSYGWEGLGERSRAPRRHPNAPSRAAAERLIKARWEHPRWGPKKGIDRLTRQFLRQAEKASPTTRMMARD